MSGAGAQAEYPAGNREVPESGRRPV